MERIMNEHFNMEREREYPAPTDPEVYYRPGLLPPGLDPINGCGPGCDHFATPINIRDFPLPNANNQSTSNLQPINNP